MSLARTVALLAVLASALLSLPSAASAKPATERMLDRVNAVRAHHGLKPLRLSHSLEHSAHHYSSHLLNSGSFGHSSRIHASRRFRTLGEILELHMGRRPAVRFTLRDWLGSSTHRSVILSSAFRFGGAGYATGRWHGRKVTIWTMHFGRH
jgi:uncharacterized protein YkwD